MGMLGKELEIKQLSWGWVANHILTSWFLRHLPHCVLHVHINRNFSLLADINRNKFLLGVPQLHYLYDSGDLPISAFYLQPRVITQKTSFSGCDSEFQVSQEYLVRPCVKQTNKTKQSSHHSAECFLYNKPLRHFHGLPMLSFTLSIQKHVWKQFKYLKLVIWKLRWVCL